jgi:hypothetical protein
MTRTQSNQLGDAGLLSLHNLDELDMPFVEKELLSIIKELPPEKTPRTGWFCWDLL